MKKAIALLTAMAIAAPIIPAVFADDPTTSTPEVTVVGKRIIDGDPYFEISLEVNGDYEDYSGVSVVLEYDPEYIVPAESWDEGATQADMSENDSWATRRALPTLGKDTWTSHTALAYEATDEESGKKTGYLYLGAEYPGQIPSTAAPGATAEPAAADPDATTAPTAEPNDDPYTNPVVVARFMYAAPTTYGDSTKTAENVSDERASTKEALEDMWQYGAHPTPAAEADRVNWDTDWSKNTILTIAPDAIAFESPAQFPFAYYDANFDERAFMFDFPTPVPTIDAAATAVPTGMPVPTPVHNQYPSGSRIAEDNQLTKDDINIVLGLGKSAKATGGLSLSDIFTIIFFDWNDTIIGTLTAGRGLKMSKDVSNYVLKTMVHPKLQGNTNYSSLDRVDTYRGEYPSSGPRTDGGNVRLPGGNDSIAEEIDDGAGNMIKNPLAGSNYPITNKLEYVAAGKEFWEGAPYAGCWTLVDGDTMSKTYTWFTDDEMTAGTYYGKPVEIDETTGWALDADGNPDKNIKIPAMFACDFDNIELDEDDSTLLVKAVYRTGTKIEDGDKYYSVDDDIGVSMLTSMNATDKAYGLSYSYRRVNTLGYGLIRPKEPKVRMTLQQVGATGATKLQVDCENSEVIPVLLAPSDKVQAVGHQLVDTYGVNIINGTPFSNAYNDAFLLEDGLNGFRLKAQWDLFREEIWALATNSKASYTATGAVFEEFGFVYSYTAATKTKAEKVVIFEDNKTSNAYVTAEKNYLMYMCQAMQKAGITDPHTITWYQVQHAMLTKFKKTGTYVNPATAKTWCETEKNFPPAYLNPKGFPASYE